MSFDKLRHAVEVEYRDAAARAAEVIRVFVAGPFIDIDKDEDHPDNIGSEAKKLRYFLSQHLSKPNISIYLGEDVDLRKNGEKNFGPRSNAVIYERHYIMNHLDAVILLPSSPGSYCETGDWIPDKNICQKMLMLMEKKYEGHASYINDGIVKLATDNGAKVIYVDYAVREEIIETCEEFITFITSGKYIDRLYGR